MQNNKTYKHRDGIGKTGQILKEFGESQNRLNAGPLRENAMLRDRTAALERQVSEMAAQIALLTSRLDLLEEAQSNNMRRFSRAATAIDSVGKEVDRLRLDTKLNSNAIDRLTKKQDT